jgi:hypothetical protein
MRRSPLPLWQKQLPCAVRIPDPEDLSDGHRLNRKPLGPTKIFMFLMEHSKPVADQLSLSRVLACLAKDLDGYCSLLL